jgi:UDP-glucose 4-epimerase
MGTKNLLDLAISGNVSSFIQASTAAVYSPQLNGIGHEFSDTQPVSPYGKTKLAAEDLVTAATQANLISGMSLRYFNVLGSSTPSLRDESRDNIVPMVLDRLLNNLEPLIFGDDYPTVDGTCVRDYIHVLELVNAHVLAAKKLNIESLPTVLNVGTGKGTTVRQVINEILLQKKSRIHPKILERRLGDPPTLIASTELAERALDFKAEIGLEKMIESAI